MEAIIKFVKPELLVVAVALYFVGVALKKAETIKDKHIPMILGICGIVLCALWVFATCSVGNVQEGLMAVFTSIIQGTLVAGLSVYVNQIVKQESKE